MIYDTRVYSKRPIDWSAALEERNVKLVSLLPSATEIVCRLGLESRLVGVSHECDYPESIAHLPRVTSSSIGKEKQSRQVHESVQDLLKNALSVYDLDLNLLNELKPDYLITQDLCDVCAVSLSQVEDACRNYLDGTAGIISLRPQKLQHIWDDVARVGETLGAREAAHEFQQDVDRRIQFIRETLQKAGQKRKKVLTIEWIDPVMIGGMWMPEMIEIAGGECLGVSPGDPAPTVSHEELDRLNPDVVLIKPCGFDLTRTLEEREILSNSLPWEKWNAYHNDHVLLVDGNAYFNRPGPRIIDSLEILAYCVHPNLFGEFGKRYAHSILPFKPQP